MTAQEKSGAFGAAFAGLTEKLPLRFWAKVRLGDDGCWEGTGARSAGGYGYFWWQGSHLRSHRLAYSLLIGPIPSGLTIDHLCRVRACVRPSHLEAVTMRENILRGFGATAINASKTHCNKGHPLSGANLYLRPDGGRRCLACKLAFDRAAYPGRREYYIAYNKSHRERKREIKRHYRNRRRMTAQGAG